MNWVYLNLLISELVVSYGDRKDEDDVEEIPEICFCESDC